MEARLGLGPCSVKMAFSCKSASPFLLSELYRSAPMHVACLHTVTDYPRTDDVQWSVVYIAGGHTLISSRVYERVDVHGQAALIRGLHQRYPDLVDVNSYLVKVHWSICSLEPVVNHAKGRYVLAVIEEDLVEPTVVLKVDLPPYVDIGAIRVPQTLTKRRLILQTGLDLVCGPGGEICACYHNGYELLSGQTAIADDGDFFACWLDGEPQRSPLVTAGGCPASPTAGWEIAIIEYTFCPSPAAQQTTGSSLSGWRCAVVNCGSSFTHKVTHLTVVAKRSALVSCLGLGSIILEQVIISCLISCF